MTAQKKKKAQHSQQRTAAGTPTHEPEPEQESEADFLSIEDRLEILEGDFEALRAKLVSHGIVF